MTYSKAKEFVDKYKWMVGTWYKHGKGDKDYDMRTTILAILVSPVDFQIETYSIWNKNGNDNKSAIDQLEYIGDDLNVYIYFTERSTSFLSCKILGEYLIEGGFVGIEQNE